MASGGNHDYRANFISRKCWPPNPALHWHKRLVLATRLANDAPDAPGLSHPPRKYHPTWVVFSWRRERDSNPRYLAAHRFSRAASSTTPAPLRAKPRITQGNVGESFARAASIAPLLRLLISSQASLHEISFGSANHFCTSPCRIFGVIAYLL